MRMMQQSMELGGGPKMSLNEYLVRPVIQNMAVVALFVAPMLTMRLFAEEKKQGTIELLATSPLTDWQIVIGKFVAAAGLFGLLILAGLVNVALMFTYASPAPEWKPIVTGALAIFLLGSCFLGVDTFVSTTTSNQIVAGILSFCLNLGIWTLGWLDDPMGGPFKKGLAYLGVTTHMDDLSKGVIDLKDLVFYLTFIGFGLFLAHRSVESQRWRA
jgi:ABC-2 type transport system permease protein